MITNYGGAICSGLEYLLDTYPDVFVIGQGVWSPWYVGNSMADLDKKFGKDRIIDTPVSEAVTTGAAVGASLCGLKPIVVHPNGFTCYTPWILSSMTAAPVVTASDTGVSIILSLPNFCRVQP